ncbi:MAG: molybdenum cofactor guanylyltransferase [Verrucomicrobia bacterium]|nr:molybdenum cofactor guanylyltransferase [Verrucomicrobiota bacterium]
MIPPESVAPVPYSAVLLAGGHSIRMHRDKALLAAGDTVLWRRQRDLLAAAGAAEIFLSARPQQAWAETAEGFAAVVQDAVPDSGPLGGIVAALERAAHPHLAVLAVDLPRMAPGWFAARAAECAPGSGVVGRRDGFFEPLAAIYPRELAPLAREMLEARVLSLQKLLAAGVAAGRLRVHEITAEEQGLFANWNEPAGPAGAGR